MGLHANGFKGGLTNGRFAANQDNGLIGFRIRAIGANHDITSAYFEISQFPGIGVSMHQHLALQQNFFGVVQGCALFCDQGPTLAVGTVGGKSGGSKFAMLVVRIVRHIGSL